MVELNISRLCISQQSLYCKHLETYKIFYIQAFDYIFTFKIMKYKTMISICYDQPKPHQYTDWSTT